MVDKLKMSKEFISKRFVNSNFKNVIKVGYCNLQHLLQFENPYGYSSSSLGWRCDYFIVDVDTIISTGYSPIGNIVPSYELLKKYDDEAFQMKASARKNDISHDQLKFDFEKLINQFATDAMKEQEGFRAGR